MTQTTGPRSRGSKPTQPQAPAQREATADTPVPSGRAGPHLGLHATFVGGGNMAMALMGGLVEAGADAARIHVIEPFAAQRERLAARFPAVRLHAAPEAAAVATSDIVVMAVKPQQMREAAQALAPFLGEGRSASGDAAPVVLTIAAGIRVRDLARWLGGRPRIVRAMPNTPALVGRGITGVFAAADVDAPSRANAQLVLEAAGEVVWFDDEADLDIVTGLASSGVAYVFYILEALEAAGADLGLDRPIARRLAYATLGGAVALARASGEEPAVLRANVTSKGGTTERGLAALREGGVERALHAAVEAATARAREMGDAFGAA
jgi:pyrroline-5-carboxylate reductase